MSNVDPILAGAPALGAILGKRFVLLREIGRGGHSLVYAARDTQRSEEVAVKFVVPPPGRAEEARQRLRREVRTLRELKHPNIVAVRDYVEESGAAYVVMELIDGSDLAQWLRRNGELGPEGTTRVASDLLAALDTAHRARVLHRDVKPANVLLDRNGRAHLADFGSARHEGHPALSATGTLAGTLVYAAPEVLAGQRGDARSDLYALGMTLFECLTGRLPDHPRHLPPPPLAGGYHPRQLAPQVPHWLDGLVARATAASPADRYPTASLMRQDLTRREVMVAGARTEATRRSCLVCETPTLPGSPLCRACEPRPVGGSRFLLVRQPGPEYRRTVAELLAADPGLVDRGHLAEAEAGRRALIEVPLAAATGLAEWLADREVATDTRSRATMWSAIPSSYLVLVAGGLGLGLFAGVVASPLFLSASPLVAGLLLVSALREVTRPALAAAEADATDGPIAPALIAELRALGPGPARELLSEVIRLARGLIERESEPTARERRQAELAPITEAAARAARELAGTDLTLARLRSEADAFGRLPDAWWNTVARTEESRDQLSQSLLELIAELGAAMSGGTLLPGAPLEGLDDLTKDLAETAAIDRAVRAELAAEGI
ncbi:MAG: serine/threonine-protein kinase [Gemmatimonadales bacterium]